MKYLPTGTDNLDYGWALSAAIWSMTRPEKAPEDTQYYGIPRVHPDNGIVFLPIDPNDTQPVHPDCDPTVLASLLTIVPEEETAATTAAIIESKGGSVNVWSLIPPSIAGQALDAWPQEETV
jgi:hypothetical protein